MIPVDLASALFVHHLVQQKRARARASLPRQAAFAALHASPVHQVLRAPLPHPAVVPHPVLRMKAPAAHPAPVVSRVISQATGVRHPTPAEVVTQSMAQGQAILAKLVASKNAWIQAHPRPAPHAQPADIAAWLKAGALSPRASFPEWGWHVIRKTPVPIAHLFGTSEEPGEAIAAVQLGSNDSVVWYEHPSGAWSYSHHWGEDFGQVLASIANTVTSAISDAAHAVQSVVHSVTGVVETVLSYVQIAASVVPGLGQVVNEVVSVAEAALDALGGESMLSIAFDTVYRGILASAPGLEALGPFLNPVMGFLRNLLNGGMQGAAKDAVHSALAAAMKQVPDAPSVGPYSPRSLAASLASWVLSKLNLG